MEDNKFEYSSVIRHRAAGAADARSSSSDSDDEVLPASVAVNPSNGGAAAPVTSLRNSCCSSALTSTMSASAKPFVDKDDKIKLPPAQLSSRARTIVGVIYGIAYLISLIIYAKTLVAIPSPRAIRDYLPVLGAMMVIPVILYSSVFLTAILFRHRIGSKLRNYALGYGLLQAFALFVYDHGTNLTDHGLYNGMVLVIGTSVIVVSVLLIRLICSLVSVRRILVAAATLTIVMYAYSVMAVRNYKHTWLSSITGLQMVEHGDAIDVPMWNPARRLYEKVSQSWEGCTFDYESVRFPVMDVLPSGLQNFWSGDWWNCPASTIPTLEVSHTVDYLAFKSLMEEAGLTKKHTSQDCDAVQRLANRRPPVDVTIKGCPNTEPLMILAFPDTRSIPMSEKKENAVQAAVLGRVTRLVIRPVVGEEDSSDDGSIMSTLQYEEDGDTITLRIPDTVNTEFFEVSCGYENRYITAVRPSIAVLARLSKQNPRSDMTRLYTDNEDLEPITLDVPHMLMLTIDAVSRVHFKRRMPRSTALLRKLGGLDDEPRLLGKQQRGKQQAGNGQEPLMHVFEYLRFHAVGYTTGENTLPLYTGCDGEPCNAPIAEKWAAEGGYATAWVFGMCEDWASSYPLFESYVDHDFYAALCSPEAHPLQQPFGVLTGPYSIRRRCLGAKYVHQHLLNYSMTLFDVYSRMGVPVYLHTTFMEGHEGTGEVLGTLDKDFANFLEGALITRGAADKTALFLLADHGLHMGLPHLWFLQGGVEHMNPMLFVGVPRNPAIPSLKKLLTDEVISNLAMNQHALLGAYDMYWTWADLIGHLRPTPHNKKICPAASADWTTRRATNPVATKQSAVTLWEAVPYRRSCDEVGVPEIFCRCKLDG